jgi:ATP-dependent helicase HrpB
MLQCSAKNVNPLEPFVTSLPVSAVLSDLLAALDAAPQVLLSAPTGAGKSTWLPLQLLAHPGINGKILLLEPRRLAARSVAQRLAELLGKRPARRWATGCGRRAASGRKPGWKW